MHSLPCANDQVSSQEEEGIDDGVTTVTVARVTSQTTTTAIIVSHRRILLLHHVAAEAETEEEPCREVRNFSLCFDIYYDFKKKNCVCLFTNFFCVSQIFFFVNWLTRQGSQKKRSKSSCKSFSWKIFRYVW